MLINTKIATAYLLLKYVKASPKASLSSFCNDYQASYVFCQRVLASLKKGGYLATRTGRNGGIDLTDKKIVLLELITCVVGEPRCALSKEKSVNDLAPMLSAFSNALNVEV